MRQVELLGIEAPHVVDMRGETSSWRVIGIGSDMYTLLRPKMFYTAN